VDEVGLFYKAQGEPAGTHLALRWNERLRFFVPRYAAARQACWKTFHPGWLEFPLRAMARLPRLLGAVSCVEGERLASIREAIGKEAGLSCCRAGAQGPWSKDTILLLDKKTAEPLYIVKAGVGEAVDLLLGNEANWLRALRDQPALIDHIPELVAHLSGTYLSFVAETPLSGKFDYRFGELHIDFLRKLQECSRQTISLQESRLYNNLRSRLKNLRGLLSEAWSTRLDKAMRRIEQSLSRAPIVLVAAHNDFTPWNIRVERGIVRVFDWEYADYEQLPLFDPLHFALMPMALRRRPMAIIVRRMRQTLQLCEHWFGKESCRAAEIQLLAYCVNLCTLYLWADRGDCTLHPVVASYARLIDYICRA
jgi:Phosphotransferase enzyme family